MICVNFNDKQKVTMPIFWTLKSIGRVVGVPGFILHFYSKNFTWKFAWCSLDVLGDPGGGGLYGYAFEVSANCSFCTVWHQNISRYWLIAIVNLKK